MSDLTTWLLEQIAAEEERARAATPGPWSVVDHPDGPMVATPAGDATMRVIAARCTDSDAAHIAANDPAATLRRCTAYRAIIEAAWADLLQIEGEWGRSRGREELSAANDYPDTLRALASIYADHPDFDPAWRLS